MTMYGLAIPVQDNQNKIPILQATGAVSTFIGLVVMTLWLLNSDYFSENFPIAFAMQFNTSTCFVLLGTAFIAESYSQSLVKHLLSAMVLLVAGLTLYQYYSGTDVGIDTLALNPFISIGASAPGRMAPSTALCFLLIAIGISLPDNPYKTTLRLGIGLIASSLATLSVISYAVNLEELTDWIGVARMSPQTSIGFIVLGFGLIHLGATNTHSYAILLVSSLCLVIYSVIILGANSHYFPIGPATLSLIPDKLSAQETNFRLVIILASVLLNLGLSAFAFLYASRYRKSAAELAESRARLAAIMDNAADGIVSVDKDGTILAANQVNETLFGLRHDELVGRNFNALLSNTGPNAENGFAQAIKQSIQPGHARSNGCELTGRHKNSSTFPIEVKFSHIDQAGQDMYCGIIRDVTVQKQSEAKLHEANTELESFAYRTSHDLRSPVSSANGLVQICICQSKDHDYELLENNLFRLQKSFLRLDSLINNIIDVTRARLMDEGDIAIPVRKIVEETMETLGHLDGFSDIAFTIDIDPELSIVNSPSK